MCLDELGIPQLNVTRDLKDELEAQDKKQGGAWAARSVNIPPILAQVIHYLRVLGSLSRVSA